MRDLEISRSCLQGYVGITGEGKGKWQYMKNGYLIDSGFSYIDEDSKLINEIARKIVDIFSDKNRLREFHNNSYEISQKLFSERLRGEWEKLLLRKAQEK